MTFDTGVILSAHPERTGGSRREGRGKKSKSSSKIHHHHFSWNSYLGGRPLGGIIPKSLVCKRIDASGDLLIKQDLSADPAVSIFNSSVSICTPLAIFVARRALPFACLKRAKLCPIFCGRFFASGQAQTACNLGPTAPGSARRSNPYPYPYQYIINRMGYI